MSEKQNELTGSSLKALSVFRERVQELQEIGQAKPDMVAYKELSPTNLPSRRIHGLLENVPIGFRVKTRGEAAILDIHRSILSGIDARKEEPCYAVCISGGYEDDVSMEDGSIWYTGAGGQRKGKQMDDQVKNSANSSLILSYEKQTPIRVLSGKFGNYRYMGVYKCATYRFEESVDGPFVYKFQLEPISGESILIEAGSHSTVKVKRKRKRESMLDRKTLPSSTGRSLVAATKPQAKRKETPHQRGPKQRPQDAKIRDNNKQKPPDQKKPAVKKVPTMPPEEKKPAVKKIPKMKSKFSIKSLLRRIGDSS